MSIFEKYTGSTSYYTEDELDRLENPEKYGYTQETYDAFVSQTQQRAENRAMADQAEMDALDSYVSSGDISFSGRSGQTSDATAGLSGFMGNFGFPAPFQQGSGDTGDVMQSAPAQVDQGIASLPDMSESSRDDSPQGEIAYYDQNTWLDGLRNMAYGPISALGKVAYGVATNQPNTPYVVQDLETGTIRMSDGTPITAPAPEATTFAVPSVAQAVPAATSLAAPSFPTSPPANTFRAPESFTQGLTLSAPSPLSSPAAASAAMTVDDLITGIPGPQATQRAATSFPTSSAATTFRAPVSFTQDLTSPLSVTPMSEAVNPSLPELPSAGLPVSAASIFLDPYETGELNPNSNVSIPQLREALAQEAIAEVLAVTNPPTMASEIITGGGDTGAIPTYTEYDDYTAADFGGGSDDLGAGDFTGGFEM